MTKSQLIERVASRTRHVSKRDIETIVDTLFGSMTEVLPRGGRIEIRGFGSFQVRLWKAREGLNPKTREQIQIAARRKPLFRVAKELRERINLSTDPHSGERVADVDSGGDRGRKSGSRGSSTRGLAYEIRPPSIESEKRDGWLIPCDGVVAQGENRLRRAARGPVLQRIPPAN